MWQFRREPALAAIGALAPAVQLLTAFFIGDAGLQGAVNATSALLAGLLAAALVKSDKLAPAILGFAQGLLALGLELGWHLSAQQQAAVMTLVGVLVAAYVRTQVDAPVPVVPLTPPSPAEPVARRSRPPERPTEQIPDPRGPLPWRPRFRPPDERPYP